MYAALVLRILQVKQDRWKGFTFFVTALITCHEVQYKIHSFLFHLVLCFPTLFFFFFSHLISLSLSFFLFLVQNRSSLLSCLRAGSVCLTSFGCTEAVAQLACHPQHHLYPGYWWLQLQFGSLQGSQSPVCLPVLSPLHCDQAWELRCRSSFHQISFSWWELHPKNTCT